ncbi:MAG: FliI/YscN family ATPase [Pseudomonadota bacterium]
MENTEAPVLPHAEHLSEPDWFKKTKAALSSVNVRPEYGVIVKAVGTVIYARLGDVSIGEICLLDDPSSGVKLEAKVVGFADGLKLLMPLGDLAGLSPSTKVVPISKRPEILVGDSLLGRVVGSDGRPVDGLGDVTASTRWASERNPPDAMRRPLIDTVLQTGIRAIDGLLTCGEGQRFGIFSEPGVGKSTLLAEIVRSADVDVSVVGLVGERGREAREFIEQGLGAEGLSKSTVVLSTSDRPALERLEAVNTATAIAEYHRDKGRRVLLLIDSITRYARATREVGLAAGEVPTRRGFPSSTFAHLPKVLERAGCSDRGSITAFYTVLVEGDGTADPVAEETRGILDGHIVLSSDLASAEHYPAIDVLQSKSRVMTRVASVDHQRAAGRMRKLLAEYKNAELLIRMGEYEQGADPDVDEAIEKMSMIKGFLCQAPGDKAHFSETVQLLTKLV